MDIKLGTSTRKGNPIVPSNSFPPEQPLVSVIIPAHNAEVYLLHTLNSVLSQTYKNIEIIVVDDGSHDSTAHLVESVMQRDNRITLLSQANSGVAAARNMAIQRSRGEYIAPVDADDIWYPQKIEKQVDCILRADQGTGLVYVWSVCIDEGGLLTGGYSAFDIEGDVFKSLIMCNFIGNASAPLIRRECFENVGGYCTILFEKNAQGCEDRDLYLRIARFYKFCVVKEFLAGYRMVDVSMSHNYRTMEKSQSIVMERVKQSYPDLPPFLFRWSWSHYCLYLSNQSRKVAHYGVSMLYLCKAARMSPVFLFYPDFYISMRNCVLPMLKQAVISVMQRVHCASVWDGKKEQPGQRTLTLSDVMRKSYCPRSGLSKLHHLRLQFIQRLFVK